MPQSTTQSTNSEPDGPQEPPRLGKTEPRLWTPPLVDLTPATSYGFDLIDFANLVLELELDPWQEWLAVRVGELLPDGRPRFRIVLVLVARQNGKTLFAKILTLFWLFIEAVPLVLGTSTSRDYAKEAWKECCGMALDNPWLALHLPEKAIRATVGEETLTTDFGSRYKIAAANRRGGRSLTVHRLIIDELREHPSWDAWDAGYNAMNAVPGAQCFAITNQGDDGAVVLDGLRDSAVTYIETGAGDPRLGLFEWSAPSGADPTDVKALAQANPDLGNRIHLDNVMGQALRAKEQGGETLAGFRTEVLCQRVHQLDPAIDPDAWAKGETDEPLDLAPLRRRVALCLDVALDQSHATLVAAHVDDAGVAHVDAVAAWSGIGCVDAVKRDLGALVAKVRPRELGWFPSGPAASIAADLRTKGWRPRGLQPTEIVGEMAAVCMGLAANVLGDGSGGGVRHVADELLDLHVITAQKLRRGDAWVFGRRGSDPIDAAYAVAGAVHLAKSIPKPTKLYIA